jgi:hypothetical protein
MKYLEKNYYGYKLEYYLQPGKWMNYEELNSLKKCLKEVNISSGKNFTYGVFDETLSEKDSMALFKSLNICVIKEKGESVGFFYNLILREKPHPIIHAGLVVVSKNKGHDLIGYPYSFMTYLQYKIFGTHYYTSISSTPSIVGVFSDSFSGVWPSYKANQIKPPSRDYLKVLDVLEEQYIKKYFKDDVLEIDKKRFVLKSASQQMGFETNMKKLSRYYKPEANYFCMFWLDYAKGEDLIQIGKVNFSAITKIRLFYSYQKVKSLMR